MRHADGNPEIGGTRQDGGVVVVVRLPGAGPGGQQGLGRAAEAVGGRKVEGTTAGGQRSSGGGQKGGGEEEKGKD